MRASHIMKTKRIGLSVESDTLLWAKHYLASGLHPIPLRPRDKRPIGAWKKYQTQSPTEDDIIKWFSSGDNNIGIVLGRGMVAVDLDGPGAEDLLRASGIEIPADAPRSRTAHGYHVFLATDEPLGDRVGLLSSIETKSQVDIRGIGYVVAPPSIHPSGAVYEWESRISKNIPKAPSALVNIIKSGLNGSKRATVASDGQPKWVSQALQGVGEGQRDDTCARLAGYFLGKGHPSDVVKTLLYAFGEKCKPNYPPTDVDKTVDSVTRKDGAARAIAEEQQDQEFQILGYNHGDYFYLPRGSRQVVELRADQHTKLHLLRLAPLQYWEQTYAGKSGVQWDMAANALIRLAEAAGVYDIARVRGRGAWWDSSQSVLHLGDSLVIGDQRIPIMKVQHGRYIYEAAPPMPIEHDDPLDIESANKLCDITELLNWEKPISARLLAGWCVVAPICGALSWRPHIWITGAAATGKSWIVENILRPLMGDIGLAVQSETTEAGLRQTLGHDARPITFDEIEGEDQRAVQRIQNVLALARQASSEVGAVIIKGTPGGVAKSYRIRSCFVFSSIGITLQHYADSTRITILSVEKRDEPAKFAKLKELTSETITQRYAQRFIARSVRLVPVIRANADIFASAGAAKLKSQRLGDQIGILLAGAYSLFDEGLVTPNEARAFIEQEDWDEQRGMQEQSDENLCLQRILEHIVRIQTKYYTGERSVAEMISIASGRSDAEVSKDHASDILGRIGIRIDQRGNDDDVFIISNSHTSIAHILSNTKWANGWGRVLRRIPGAQTSDGVVRFGATRSRGVEISLTTVECDDRKV